MGSYMDRKLKIFIATIIIISAISQFLPFKNDIVSLITVITNLAAFMGLSYACIYSRKVYPHLYLTLLLLSAAQFFSFLGDFTWFILESILSLNPFPSVADIFYLLYYPLFAAGIFTIPVRRYSDLRSTTDLLIILVAWHPPPGYSSLNRRCLELETSQRSSYQHSMCWAISSYSSC